MLRKFITVLAVSAFALTTLAPVEASAQRWRDHRGDYGDAYGCRDDNNYGCERDRDRRQARNGYGYGGGYGYGDRYGDDYYHRGECYDRRGRNHCYDRNDDDDDDAVAAGVIGLVLGAVLATAVSNSGNQDRDYNDRNYDRGYSDQRYAPQQPQCTRRERQWDRYANRYVTVDVPC